MKILFFIDSLRSGGKERRFTELVKQLRKTDDVQFEIVVMDRHIHYREILDLNIPIHYLIRSSKKDLRVFPKFYKICKRYRPDIIHCWDDMTAVIAASVSRLLKIKLVNGMVVDTPVVRNFSNKYWLRGQLTFPFSHLIIGNSKAGLEAYKAPLTKSLCIYNGIDFKRFEGLKDSVLVKKEILDTEDGTNLFIVGMVAAFEDRKDYMTLIRAAVSLLSRHENFRFILVGEGVHFTRIKNSVPAEHARNIIFLGRRSDVETIVNIFDVGILLTDTKFHGEGISNSILEYMASGKPVIATRGGGTNEVVIDGENGYLADAYNEKQLEEKIEELFHDKEKRLLAGNKGRLMIKEKFDLKAMADHYIEAYKRVLK